MHRREGWLWGLMCGITILMMLGGAYKLSAQPQDDPVILSLDLDTATVGDVLDLLFNEAQVSFSATPDILALPIGRLRLKNCRVSEVLNYIAQQAGLQWHRDERGVYILARRLPEPVKSSETKETEKPVLPTPPRIVSPEEQRQRLENVPIVTETIKLRHIPVADVCFLLGIPVQGISPYQLMLQDFAARRRPGLSPISRGKNQVTPLTTSVNPVLPPTPTSTQPSLTGIGPIPALQSPNGAETAGQYIPGGIGGLGGFGFGGVPGGFGGLGFGGLGFGGLGFGGLGFGGLGIGGAALGAFIGGIQQIIGLPAQNVLLVRGTPQAIQEIRDILREIDVPPDQVEIESQFVEVSGSLQDIYGIDWSVAGREVNVVTGLTVPEGTINIGFVRGNLSATIGALLTRSKGKVIQAPRAFTINGLPVVFSSDIDRPVIVQETYTDGLVTRTTTYIDIYTISISLFAVPFINADNTVTVYIQPMVQDIPEYVQNPAGGTIPVVSSTWTQALIRVRDGESFAIGGLLRTRNSEARREVPLLARLPFIGSLFKTKAHDVDEKNLVIFVTPRIVRAEEITPKEL